MKNMRENLILDYVLCPPIYLLGCSIKSGRLSSPCWIDTEIS